MPPNQLGDFGKDPSRVISSSEVRVCTVAESLYMSGRSLSALEPGAALAGNGADTPYAEGRYAPDGRVESPSLCMAMKKSGRRVARLPAVIARPCSTDDQIAISVVDPSRVSTW